MNYCPYCGAKLNDTATFCPMCGKPLNSQYPPQPNASNSFGVASLVLGIVGLLTTNLFGFGFVLGIIAIVTSCKSKQSAGTNGLATAGLVLGIISVVCGFFFLAYTVSGTWGIL